MASITGPMPMMGGFGMQPSGVQLPAGFDGQRYLQLNPDVAAAGMDPVTHYTTFGFKEGRNLGIPPAAPAAATPQPMPTNVPAAENAFNSYLDSTGYKFMFGQGQDAITNSMAAKGLLNSGATAKALTKFGQNLGKSYFSDYLNQLSNVQNALGGTASAGQNALGQIATAGTAGGGNAANAIITGAGNQGAAIMSGGNAMGNAIAGAAGSIGNAISNMPSGNFFG